MVYLPSHWPAGEVLALLVLGELHVGAGQQDVGRAGDAKVVDLFTVIILVKICRKGMILRIKPSLMLSGLKSVPGRTRADPRASRGCAGLAWRRRG